MKRIEYRKVFICGTENPYTFLVRQRPATGLLAGLWEFGHVEADDLEGIFPAKAKAQDSKRMRPSPEVEEAELTEAIGFPVPERTFTFLGFNKHIFSHLEHRDAVFLVLVTPVNSSLDNRIACLQSCPSAASLSATRS